MAPTIPKVRRDEDFVEELHGVKVPDPYRWLEDPDSEETKAFATAQNTYTSAFIDRCIHKDYICDKLTKLWNYPKYSVPFKRGSKYFFFMNTGLQNQSVLYIQDSLTGEPRVFLDPNTFSEDGTVSIQGSSFSEDGEIFAYGLCRSGSDWIEINFKRVSPEEEISETLEKVKFSSMAWTHDNKGLFYGCYPDQGGKTDGTEVTANENHKIYYHRVGTPQSEDLLIAEFPENPKWLVGAEVTDCGKYLIVTPSKDYPNNLVYYADISKGIQEKPPLLPVIEEFEFVYEYLTNDGTMCIFRTNKEAPNYRLIKIDLENPDPKNWSTLIPEHEKDVLDWAACVDNNKLVVCYISDVKNILQVKKLEDGGLICNLPLELGTISGFSCRRKQSEIFYMFTSFLTPGIIYHLDFTKPELNPQVFRKINIEGVDTSKLTTTQVFYSSKDGTKVPMFIVHNKNVEKNGAATTLLYGYGGFNISLQPYFSISRILFLQMFNGVLAIPNIRGGGEYGEKWYAAGKVFNKQNVFDDFQCAAEFLIAEKYTSPEHLVIQGGSNGGLLVGACANQRPDLYKAVIADCGVMDMLRFHKFTIGYAWTGDYGCSDNEKHFKNLIKFSPLHNVKRPDSGQYPAMLLTTADHDDRVVPLHSFKLISELQYRLCIDNPSQKNPIVIRIKSKAGHGSGKPTKKIIEEQTDNYCFIIEALGIEKVHTEFQ